MKKNPRVMVAMSGGVDSSVVAGLMVRRGFDVTGVTMQIWQENQRDPRHAGCCSLGAVEDARRVARSLGIPYYVINFRREFRESVIRNFMDEYEQGRTPNPCVQCNRHVKFDALLQKAAQVGCDLLVTGHYARVRWSRRARRWSLMRARDKSKDQSYALYMLTQGQLAKVRFPLGELASKSETRAIARALGLSVADKPDSQEICFVSEAGGYHEFIRANRPDAFVPGEIVDSRGRRLGTHDGVAQFTVGQRKRLRLNVDGRPMYVLRLEPARNRVVAGSDDELLQRVVLFDDELAAVSQPTTVTGRIRYNMPPVAAVLHPGTPARAEFKHPVRAVTPGQAAVFYRGETLVAGGAIVGPGEERALEIESPGSRGNKNG